MKISNFLIGLSLVGLSLPVLGPNEAWSEDLSDIKQSAEAGAPQLALRQLDQGIAQASGDTQAEWQRWQWQLLGKVGSADTVLQRAASLPKDTPADVQLVAASLAASAALSLGDGVLSRTYLARLLWVLPTDKTTYRELRAMVVQSHLMPQPDAEAASVMLRYQQDFGTDVALLRTYALAMLQAGREAEVVWARTQLPQDDPVTALIDANSDQLSDVDTRQRLLAVLNDNAVSTPMLLMVRKITAQMNAPELQIQTNERLLSSVTPPQEVTATDMWKAYRSLTQSFGNVRLLLFGSDAGWADLARESASNNKVMARAIWAYLAREAQDPALRSEAQQQFLTQLLVQHLDRAALRLFISAWPDLPASAFNAAVRYRLGQLALDEGEYKLAAGLWQDIEAVPTGVNTADWQVHRATLFVRQGLWSAAGDAVSAWLDQVATAPPDAGWQMGQVVQQMSQQATMTAPAQDLFKRLLPVVAPLQRRVVQYRLGQMADAQHKPLAAAQWYLQAATQLPLIDGFAAQARLDAAASLDQAGLHEDAKTQYALVLKTSPDIAQQAAAQYALSTR